ncbi:Flagellar hook-basal body complex protein FliE [Buchnera aphidicola (Cinara cuneomaculata)]|uniref:Flagellar hook-basal body complex protein FliE n=1 Tax=Buchnera aphidicola (Cinara cuneomaculata) TaxID=1660040 RepID=A0A451CY13_9GAMM|nr:hypothetical protein [Buchnera aphidicola]VFP78026.1 Flagellar hook-basal body complex protein FliE [Buchnera aphidicola (Cinara cuneomaculata)]
MKINSIPRKKVRLAPISLQKNNEKNINFFSMWKHALKTPINTSNIANNKINQKKTIKDIHLNQKINKKKIKMLILLNQKIMNIYQEIMNMPI